MEVKKMFLCKVKLFGVIYDYLCEENNGLYVKAFRIESDKSLKDVKIPKSILESKQVYVSINDLNQVLYHEDLNELNNILDSSCQNSVDEDYKIFLSFKKLEINGLISQLGLKIRNCEDMKIIKNYENMLNVIEEILLTEKVKIENNVSANIKAKLDNK